MRTNRDAKGGLSWPAAIKRFLESWVTDHPGLRPTTLAHYREQLETRIAVFAADRGIASVDRFTGEDLHAFVDWLDAYRTYRGPISQRGKQMALNCAKMLLRWAYEEGLLADDISRAVRSYRLDAAQTPRATRSNDLEALLSALSPYTSAGIRNTAMVHLMALCGLRPAEVCDLNAGDLYPSEGIVIVRAGRGRGRRARNVELPSAIRDGRVTTLPQMVEALMAWLKIRAKTFPHLEDDDPLFVTLEPGRAAGPDEGSEGATRPAGQRMTVEAIRLMLRRAAERAGIDPKHVTARRLRHHFGFTAAASGVGRFGLMESMGISSLRMTERYTAGDEEDHPLRPPRANVVADIQFPRQRRSQGRTDEPEAEGMSLSEIARWLFNRE